MHRSREFESSNPDNGVDGDKLGWTRQSHAPSAQARHVGDAYASARLSADATQTRRGRLVHGVVTDHTSCEEDRVRLTAN